MSSPYNHIMYLFSRSQSIYIDFYKGLTFHVLALLRLTPLTRQRPAGLPVIHIYVRKGCWEDAMIDGDVTDEEHTRLVDFT